jgi:hypothetical protein
MHLLIMTDGACILFFANMLSTRSVVILGLSLILGLGIFGMQVVKAVKKGREFDRYLTVRGLSEREVKATLAIWPIRFSVNAGDLLALKSAMERDQGLVIAFLQESGISPNDITLGLPSVSDRMEEETTGKKPALSRYKGTVTIVVRSADVDVVKKAIQHIEALLDKGIALSGAEYGDQPEFLFTDLNQVKPDMIREATANARASAEKFAEDSKTRVGAIRRATQGALEIEDRDKASPEKKIIRVVTTIDFFVE